MYTLSNLLINESIDNYYSTFSSEKYNEKIATYQPLFIPDNMDLSIIEHIDDQEYYLKEQEIKYKIFENISYVTKTSDGKIELIFSIPQNYQIISINKIKLSNKINLYIQDMYICLNNKKIITKNNLYNKFNKNEFLINNNYNNIIKCNNNTNNKINLHIILSPIALNFIINKYIYITYSYANYKNKIKYI